MKKHILSGLLWGILIFFPMKATATSGNHSAGEEQKKSTTMRLGYTQGESILNVGAAIKTYIKGAIQFPESYMAQLKGNRITAIRLAIGAELSEQENDVFIAYNLNEKPLYTQKVDVFNVGWNEIRLETPFEITGEELFIGFSYLSEGDVTSLDGGEDNNLANWLSVVEHENEERTWGHQSGGCLNIQVIVEGDNLPQNDAALLDVSTKKYAHPGTPFPVDLIVRNMAAAEIQSLTVTCTVEGQAPVVQTIDNISIKSNDIGLVPLNNIIIKESDIYNMSIKIDEVNGVADENSTDNSASVERIFCRDEYTNRKVLLEQYSTMNCANCPAAHQTIEHALKYKRDVIRIVHHSGYGTDLLTIPASEEYLFFFKNETGNGSVYAPALMLDRTNMSSNGADNGNGSGTPGPAFFVRNSNVSKLIEKSTTSAALLALTIDRKYDSDSRLLTVSVSGEITAEDIDRLNGDNICLNIVLTEDSILGMQVNAPDPNNYYHNHAVRKVITSTWGDPIEFTGKAFQSQEYTFVVPEGWEDRQMHVIAFVANSDRKNPNNCKVYNAEEIELADDSSASIQGMELENENLHVYYNRKDECLYMDKDYDNATIYNTTGNILKFIPDFRQKINLNPLGKGIYFIRFNINGTSSTHKFLITQ